MIGLGSFLRDGVTTSKRAAARKPRGENLGQIRRGPARRTQEASTTNAALNSTGHTCSHALFLGNHHAEPQPTAPRSCPPLPISDIATAFTFHRGHPSLMFLHTQAQTTDSRKQLLYHGTTPRA